MGSLPSGILSAPSAPAAPLTPDFTSLSARRSKRSLSAGSCSTSSSTTPEAAEVMPRVLAELAELRVALVQRSAEEDASWNRLRELLVTLESSSKRERQRLHASLQRLESRVQRAVEASPFRAASSSSSCCGSQAAVEEAMHAALEACPALRTPQDGPNAAVAAAGLTPPRAQPLSRLQSVASSESDEEGEEAVEVHDERRL